MNFTGKDEVSEILAKSNPTASKLWRVANVSGVLAVLGMLAAIGMIVLVILAPAITGNHEDNALMGILPVLSMLAIIGGGLAYFVFTLCLFILAIVLKEYAWAIGIFAFSVLAVVYRVVKAGEIKAGKKTG